MRWFKHLAVILCLLLLILSIIPEGQASGIPASLLMRLSTRTGPGTQYDEPGTYFQNDWRTTQVEVMSAAWDNRNDIWWVQVDFTTARGAKFRAYTGLKRVDVDINTVYHEQPLGTAKMTSAAKAYWGPGRDYVESKFNVPNHTKVTVFGAENGFVQVEFFDARMAKSEVSRRRAWVTERAVSGSWSSPVTFIPFVTLAPTTVPGSEAFSFCPSCGKKLPDGNTFAFCPYCGTSLTGGGK
ncbi:MAG: zinc ribbon domain-containing protein [Bacillota bacterium]|nr:zinc ribbon domain-containing protein [Bacillota bacterium]